MACLRLAGLFLRDFDAAAKIYVSRQKFVEPYLLGSRHGDGPTIDC